MSIKSLTLSGTAPDTVYQSEGQTAVTTMYFCNKGLNAYTVNVHLVPKGELATDDNLIYWALQITSNDTYVCDTERIILDDGDMVVVQASFPGSIVATVSYVGV